MRIMGVDPGITGGMALIDTSSRAPPIVTDMPMVTDGKKKTISGRLIADWIEEHAPDLALVEEVSAMPGQGVVSMFSFGQTYGITLGAISAMNVPIEFIRPSPWKKKLKLLGTDKDAARALALRLYPKLSKELARKRDIGRADALLIAHYRTLQ